MTRDSRPTLYIYVPGLRGTADDIDPLVARLTTEPGWNGRVSGWESGSGT